MISFTEKRIQVSGFGCQEGKPQNPETPGPDQTFYEFG
jgi:hypothetical protein